MGGETGCMGIWGGDDDNTQVGVNKGDDDIPNLGVFLEHCNS